MRPIRRVSCEHVFVVYAELHCHSAFSFLDGASLPEELASAAAELGYDTLALTDHDGVCGSVEFAQAASSLGLRAVHVAEMTLAEGHRHVTLVVEAARGWGNLSRVITPAHENDRAKHEPPPAGPLEFVLGHADG